MVSVVIPVFNKSELTRRCLDSLLGNSTKVSEVRVIDNHSTDDTPAVLAAFEPLFRDKGILFSCVRTDSNLGFGRACNIGIREARGEWIAIVNNDTWLMPSWDEVLMDEATRRKLDLIGPHFDERPWTDSMESRAREFIVRNRGGFRRHFVPILMFFKKTSLDRLRLDHGGIFDERFFVTYEDADLHHRMDLAGMRYGQTGHSFIWHQSMGTRSAPGLLRADYEQEGLRLFIEKWGFDPRKAENTLLEKLKRKWRKSRSARGLF
ncbi:MAG: glycosyltransferase family 2 protein [Proteobacteria bacterium]|nr:glycosyltransferase family 2 protein [Pseudomonadota bacterium]